MTQMCLIVMFTANSRRTADEIHQAQTLSTRKGEEKAEA